MGHLYAWMLWKRAGASTSLSMMNLKAFLLSCCTCMHSMMGQDDVFHAAWGLAAAPEGLIPIRFHLALLQTAASRDDHLHAC